MAGRKITVYGGNLFAVAGQYLNDPTQWNRIAQASGTGIDPVLPSGGPIVLTLPPVDTSQGGGIYGL